MLRNRATGEYLQWDLKQFIWVSKTNVCVMPIIFGLRRFRLSQKQNILKKSIVYTKEHKKLPT